MGHIVPGEVLTYMKPDPSPPELRISCQTCVKRTALNQGQTSGIDQDGASRESVCTKGFADSATPARTARSNS